MIFRFLSTTGTVTASLSIDAAAFTIGRGPACALKLPHADVRFVHAEMQAGPGGVIVTAMRGAALGLEGAPVETARLSQPGDAVVIGPYTLTLDGKTAAGDWSVSVRQAADAGPDEAALAAGYARAFDTRLPNVRLAGFALTCAVLLLFLVLPLLLGPSAASFAGRAAPAPPPRPSLAVLWNVGAISTAHASFGGHCAACHAAPFQHVQSSVCLTCHQNIGQHADPVLAPAADLRPQRCEMCHLEHKGAKMAARDSQADCAGCHRNIQAWAPRTALRNATDFADNHPPFRLALVRDAVLRTTMRADIGDTNAPDHGNLRMTHGTHLKLPALRNKAGDAACATCHVAQPDGASFKPVTFDTACASCHTLQFEPLHPEWRLPHGHAEDVPNRLAGYYAQAALNGETFSAPASDLFFKPGAPPPPAPPTGVAMVSAQVAATMMSSIARSTCGECHTTLTRADTAPGWTIAPVFVPDRYFPSVKFSHAQHATSACATCHAARGSNGGPALLLPGISTCRQCHAGAAGAALRVATGCASCHRFHNDDMPLRPASVLGSPPLSPTDRLR